MRLQTLLLLTYLCCIQLSQGQTPCLDPYACNFNTPEECFYTDLDGLPCVVGGCTNALACNFNTDADIDDGSCEFTSCIGCVNPLACNFDSLAVYDDGSCITFIDCNGICGGTWIQNDCGICYDPSAESTQESTIEIAYTGGPTEVEVPLSAISASLVVKGAQGGNGGGHGAVLETIEFPVIPGSVMHCYVGGTGIVIQSSSGGTGGGGGASCVSWQDETGLDLYVIAGGGGGRDYQGSNYSLMDASLTTSGHAGEQGGPGGEMGADGGSTFFSGYISGGGGGGFISASQGDYFGTTAQGSTGSFGFGGGGGGTGEGIGNSGGGGGGYSGGGGGAINKDGGGGGSFSDVALVNSQVSNPGNGTIQLTFHLTIIPDCIPGCTSELACNYDATATFDNGTCDHCLCGEGTTWDSTLQQCVSIAPPCAPSCGNGTVWDPINEECIIAIPADLNYDGCVTVADLLELLAVHGTCPPYPEWPDEPTDTTWTCGDPLTYWDYDYATVLIGDQCWFADDLVAPGFSNGALIDEVTDNNQWQGTSLPARFTYPKCASDSVSDSLLGVLYNGFCVRDAQGLCPVGWQVPTDEEWQTLEVTLGMDPFDAGMGSESGVGRGTDQGHKLKSSPLDFPDWNGSNEVGFNAHRGGYRSANGGFTQTCLRANFWTSTPYSSDRNWERRLTSFYDGVGRQSSDLNEGWAVRCLKD